MTVNRRLLSFFRAVPESLVIQYSLRIMVGTVASRPATIPPLPASMPVDPANTVYYRRARFATRLPLDRLYSRAHYWLLEVAPGRWRVGFTKFATRMLGDMVEHELNVAPGDEVSLGQSLGWAEGFKAITDLYSPASGRFAGGNSALIAELSLVDTDPYDRGWLYEIEGQTDPATVDAAGYIKHLDLLIGRLLASQHAEDDACPTCDIEGTPERGVNNQPPDES